MMMQTNQRPLLLTLSLLLLVTLACGLSPTAVSTPALSSPATPAAVQDAVATALAQSPDGIAPTDPLAVTPDQGSTSPTLHQIPAAAVGLEFEQMLIDIYQRANPAVVQIFVYVSATSNPIGTGSGFVYDETGRIVTNNHVVEGGQILEVSFFDGSRRLAQIEGTDVDSDLAVIVVDNLPEGVHPLPLGNSDELRVGQVAVAIGSPFRQAGSMSLGIISGLGRDLPQTPRVTEGVRNRYTLPQVIQTDAAVNPGNSGGPLLNLQGEVIGVNSAIATVSGVGVGSGVGFAIPVKAVQLVIPSLIENGRHIYPFMGVSVDTPNLVVQEQLGLPQVPGVYVMQVTAGSPADQAGIIAANRATGLGGDMIVGINGQNIRDFSDLISYLVFDAEVGQTIQVTVLRDGETLNLPLTLAPRP